MKTRITLVPEAFSLLSFEISIKEVKRSEEPLPANSYHSGHHSPRHRLVSDASAGQVALLHSGARFLFEREPAVGGNPLSREQEQAGACVPGAPCPRDARPRLTAGSATATAISLRSFPAGLPGPWRGDIISQRP